MAYIVVGIAVWIVAGFAVALLLGRAIKVADHHEAHDRFVSQDTVPHTASRL